MANGVKRFALLGAAGYIAPRHMAAIKHVGGELVAVCDPHDSVGIVDRFSMNCLYFREYERFERFLSTVEEPIHYLVVCTPNYLHDSHAALGLRVGADVILEKPPCVRVRNLERLIVLEEGEFGNFERDFLPPRVWCIFQLRHSKKVQELKKAYAQPVSKPHMVTIDYFTPRGNWYDYSWKGDPEKSGWIVTNIGVHLFDLLTYIFGEAKQIRLNTFGSRYASGYLALERAHVRWALSTELTAQPTRIITIDGVPPLELSDGFTDLHDVAYEAIVSGKGFSLRDAMPSLTITEELLKQYFLRRRGGER